MASSVVSSNASNWPEGLVAELIAESSTALTLQTGTLCIRTLERFFSAWDRRYCRSTRQLASWSRTGSHPLNLEPRYRYGTLLCGWEKLNWTQKLKFGA